MRQFSILNHICSHHFNCVVNFPSNSDNSNSKHQQNLSHQPQVLPYSRNRTTVEKSLGNNFNIQLQQQMGIFQAPMLEAFQSLQDELWSFQKTSKQPQVEVDQTSALAYKPGPSYQTASLDSPPPRPPRTTSHPVEEKEVEYGPALQQGLGADHNASDQHSLLSNEPSKVALIRPKKHSHSHKKHAIEPRSASD